MQSFMRPPLAYDDHWMRLMLVEVKTIAVVGLSHDEAKASFEVAAYLKQNGYRVIPVNPRPGIILGEAVYPELSAIPMPIDLVNVFRPSAFCAEIVRQALPLKPRAIWLQLGIANDEAARLAGEADIPIVMDRCIKIEHRRLLGEKLVDPSVL